MKRNLFSVYMNEADAGDGLGQGTGGGDAPPAPTPPDFLSMLDYEHREALEKQGIKDVQGLVKNWSDQRSYIGNSIRVPSSEAGAEDWNKFYEKLQKHAPDLIPRPDKDKPETIQAVLAALGRPEKPEEYDIPNAPEGMPVDGERVEALRKIAHESGLTRDQFKTVMAKMLESESAAYQQQKQVADAELAALKQDWGSAFDERSHRVAKMLELTQAPADVIEMAKNNQLGADVAKWMYNLSVNFKGEGANMAADQGGNRAMTPEEANAQISEIYANRSHPFWNASHPDHKAALKKMIELGRFADPSASSNADDLRISRSAGI